MAQKLLTAAQKRVRDATGDTLNIGEFPDDAAFTGNGDSPTEIADRTAHAIARVGDRFTFLRKFSRHFEGSDKKSGLFSDLFGALIALYKRNPGAFDSLARQVAGEMQQRRTAAQKAANNNSQPTPGGIEHDAR